MNNTLTKTATLADHANDNFCAQDVREANQTTEQLVSNESDVSVNSAKLDVMCWSADGSAWRPYLSTVIEKYTGKILFHAVEAEPMSCFDLVALGAQGQCNEAVMDLSSPTANVQSERYHASIERFLHSVENPEKWDLHSLNDFVQTYAAEFYNV